MGDLSNEKEEIMKLKNDLKNRDKYENDYEQSQKIEKLLKMNLYNNMNNQYLTKLIPSVLEAGEAYGETNIGNGERVQVEFVSANPMFVSPYASPASSTDGISFVKY
jgi:arginyl-tRNA synthetase